MARHRATRQDGSYPPITCVMQAAGRATQVQMRHACVSPVIAVVLGAILLKERIAPVAIGGMALVLLGVWGVLGDKLARDRAVAHGGGAE